MSDYFRLLDMIHGELQPRTYVEIGIRFGQSLALALPGTQAIGIDPAYDIRYKVDRSAQLFRMTSDEFFETQDVAALLGGLPVDLSFIDGLHLFEVALRDFMCLERCSSPNSAIFLHDCDPPSESSAAREQLVSGWAGDVWKVIVLLREYRPDLTVHTVDVGPAGLGIVHGLDPESRVLDEHYDEIVARYTDMPYAVLDDKPGRTAVLNRIPATWSSVRAALPSEPYRHDDAVRLRRLRALRRPSVASVRHAMRLRLRTSPVGAPIRRLKRSVSEGRQ